jgi:hypothetical protein
MLHATLRRVFEIGSLRVTSGRFARGTIIIAPEEAGRGRSRSDARLDVDAYAGTSPPRGPKNTTHTSRSLVQSSN